MYNSLEQLIDEMHHGIVEFKYTKKDGTIRTAHGTKKLDIVPEEMQPKGTGIDTSDDVTRYFDTDKNGWRSFINTSLVID